MRRLNVIYVVITIFVTWNVITYMTLVGKPTQTVHRADMRERLDQLEAAVQVQLEFNKALLRDLELERNSMQNTPKPVTQEEKDVKQISDKADSQNDKQLNQSVTVAEVPVGATVLPVLLIACNRPDAVKRTIDQLIKFRSSAEKFPIIVSQDCAHQPTADAVKTYGNQVTLVQHPDQSDIIVKGKLAKFKGYYKIARHYKWALTQIFDVMNYKAVIIVEDDLDISPDFFEYFEATFPILHSDSDLWCVSAWNDNGKADRVSDEAELVYRTDFFPGLGWMMEKPVWDELKVKWPETFWDDWMRHPDQRKNRACIRPEISRTKTFGAKGVSKGQFYNKYLKFIRLNDKLIKFTEKDLSYLKKENYDAQFVKDVYSSKVTSLTEVQKGRLSTDQAVRIQYSDKNTFKHIAKSLGIMEDLKSGVPRAGYRGAVSIFYNGVRVYIAPPADWKGYDTSWN